MKSSHRDLLGFIATVAVFFIFALYMNISTVSRVTVVVDTNENLYHSSQLNERIDEPLTWEPFNNTNPNYDWCPFALCHNSPICTPCDRRWLFIAATGRSASTTLMKMFHRLPGVRFTGENNNQIYLAYETVQNLEGKAAHQLLKQPNSGAWMHNSVPHGSMACVSQKIMEAINPPPMDLLLNKETARNIQLIDKVTIYGMKEIRFHKGNWTAKEAAKFIRSNFPCARVLGNIRIDTSAQLHSLNSTFERNVQLSKIDSYNEFIKSFIHELGADRAKLLFMEEWTSSVQILNDVAQWLGFIDCSFNDILHENKGGFARDNTTSLDLGSGCRHKSK